MSKSTSSSSGISFLGLLGILFIGLKLAGVIEVYSEINTDGFVFEWGANHLGHI